MVLWERADALAMLDEMHLAAARSGGVALIAGEAGIGKSALVRAFTKSVGTRARVLVGLCDPLVTPRASGPLHDIARQAGGALAQGLAARASQPELLAALIEELSGPRPRTCRILVIEDVHWADEATHDLIVFLGRRIEHLAAMLILTYRDDEIGPEHPLRPTLAALPRHVVRAIPIKALSAECVAAHAVEAGRDGGELFTLSGGNPLLLTELLATEDRSVPATVQDLVLARLGRLSVPAKEVARLVAVMPTSADTAALDGLAAAVDECIAAGVLVSVGTGVAYRHELMRRAVERSLSPARQTELHRRALAVLGALDDVDPARLVHHARHAGDVAALLRYGVTAATDAAAHGAHREAVAHFRAVRPHIARLEPARRAELLEQHAIEAYLAGGADEGLAAMRAALYEREGLGEPTRIGENHRWISRLEWWSGRGAQARAEAIRAVEVLAPGGPSPELAMAYSNRSQLHMLAHELDDAVTWGQRARELADRTGDLETSIHASVNVGAAHLLAGDAAGVVELREAHDRAAMAGLADHATRALVCVTAYQQRAWQYDDAAPVLDEALGYASANDLDGYVQHLLGLRAELRLERCEWEAALADCDNALGRPFRGGVAVQSALVTRGRILAARGAAGALSTLDAAAMYAFGTDEVQRIGPVAAARAEYFTLAGDRARAAEEARRGLTLARAKGEPHYTAELTYWLWRATGAVDEPGPGSTPYDLLMRGDWAAAAAAWAALGGRYAQVCALAQGDGPAVTEALRALSALGAGSVAELARADLRRRGVTAMPRGPRRSTASNAAGLTARQLDVLALLADGLTNPDIAARLTLSPKTVEHHVSAILEKLQVATRGQAIAAAHRLSLVAQRAD